MSTRNKQLVKLLVRILITGGLLVWVFMQIDLEQFEQAVKEARWYLLAAVWVLTVILYWIRSIKMQLILKKQDCEISVSTIFKASAVTSLYSMILPGVISTGAKWYILKKDSGKGSNVLSSMVYNQLLTMIVVIAFGLAALMITSPGLSVKTDANIQWLLLICGILLTGVVFVTFLVLNRRTGGKIISGI